MTRGIGFSPAPGNIPIDPSSTTPYVISRRDRTRRERTRRFFDKSVVRGGRRYTNVFRSRRADGARDRFHTRRSYEGIRPERRWMGSVQQLLVCRREGTTHEKELLD